MSIVSTIKKKKVQLQKQAIYYNVSSSTSFINKVPEILYTNVEIKIFYKEQVEFQQKSPSN